MTPPVLSHAVVYYQPLTTTTTTSSCRQILKKRMTTSGTSQGTQTPDDSINPNSNSNPSDDDDRFYMPGLSKFKNCSLVLGLLVGLLIYLSTLGAEFVGVLLWGHDLLLDASASASDTDTSNNQQQQHLLIAFSLGWNLVTTIVAITMLSSLRQLVSVVFLSASMHNNNTNSSKQDQDSRMTNDLILAELLSHMEGRFAVGALVGICGSWNIANFILGIQPQVLQSMAILAVACLWCKATLVLLSGRKVEEGNDCSMIYEHANIDDGNSSREEQGLSTPLMTMMV